MCMGDIGGKMLKKTYAENIQHPKYMSVWNWKSDGKNKSINKIHLNSAFSNIQTCWSFECLPQKHKHNKKEAQTIQSVSK